MNLSEFFKNLINSKNLDFDCLFKISFIYMFAIFLIVMFSSVGFIFHIAINKFYIIISSLIAILLFCLFCIKDKSQNKFLQVLLFIIPIIVSFIYSLVFYDNSWDGRNYHQGGIAALANGWNPIYENLSININNTEVSWKLWCIHYPKIIEILCANIYTVFNNIEIGKIFNFLFSWICFYLSIFTISKFKNIKLYQNILLSLIFVFNPVCICQVKTFYIDFYIYFLFLNLIYITIIKYKDSSYNNFCNLLLLINLIILAGVKFGGVFYSLIFLISYLIFALIKKEKIKSLLILIFSYLILFGVLNINPYITNILDSKNPFYPIFGKEKIDIVTPTTPYSFADKSYLYKFIYSTFGTAKNNTNLWNNNPEQLKIPFQIRKDEIKFYTSDVRSGGFGYFWGGIILLTLLLSITSKNNENEDKSLYYFIMMVLLIAVFANPINWWARYVPMFWCLPIFLLIYRMNNDKLKFFQKSVICLLLLAFAANCSICEIQNNEQACISTKYTKNLINNLKKSQDVVLIYNKNDAFYDFAYLQKFKENNIQYKFVDTEYYEKNKMKFYPLEHSIQSLYINKKI